MCLCHGDNCNARMCNPDYCDCPFADQDHCFAPDPNCRHFKRSPFLIGNVFSLQRPQSSAKSAMEKIALMETKALSKNVPLE